MGKQRLAMVLGRLHCQDGLEMKNDDRGVDVGWLDRLPWKLSEQVLCLAGGIRVLPLAEGACWLSSRLGRQANGGLAGQLLQGCRWSFALPEGQGQAGLVLVGAARCTAGASSLLRPLCPHATCIAECLRPQGTAAPHRCLACATLLALLHI